MLGRRDLAGQRQLGWQLGQNYRSGRGSGEDIVVGGEVERPSAERYVPRIQQSSVRRC